MSHNQQRPQSSEELIGRSEELDRTDVFLEDVETVGGSLVLIGEPGIGKTALLHSTSERALTRDIRVLRGSGIEFESAVAFAGLQHLLLPLRDEVGEVPASGDVLDVWL